MSAAAVRAMGNIARRHGRQALIAPVRPSWKERYPLAPIERYACWRRPDGLLFDHWMRVHERIGATVLKPEPLSLKITGTIAEWQNWTGMTFPTAATTGSPAGLPPCTSTATAAATGSRTSGCATTCEGTVGGCDAPARLAEGTHSADLRGDLVSARIQHVTRVGPYRRPADPARTRHARPPAPGAAGSAATFPPKTAPIIG